MLKRDKQNTTFRSLQLIACLMTCSVCPQSSQSQEAEDKTANVVEVVVPGVGLSKEEAQKDAYRNAVRQVVGLYVDSKTLVENDQLIEDKVLSASNGVVRTAKTIPDSVTENNGLWRLRARVTVEVTRVKSVLAEANVTMRKIDGESLFAKALSKMEKKQNSTELLKELLSELPQMLKLSLQGEPDYDAETGELLYAVELQPDIEAYREFLPRITKALEAVAVKRLPDSTVRPVPSVELGGDFRRNVVKGLSGFLLAQKDPRTDSSQAIISVLSFWNKSHTSQKWKNFVVDVGTFEYDPKGGTNGFRHWLQELGWNVTSQKPIYPYEQQLVLEVEVELLDKAGDLIDVDQWPWKFDAYQKYDTYDGAQLMSGPPNILNSKISSSSNDDLSFDYWGNKKLNHYFVAIAPLCMAIGKDVDHQKNYPLLFRDNASNTRRIKFSADQLKDIANIKIKHRTKKASR